jgi:hypothetical protein
MRRVVVLAAALEDLAAGRDFYDAKEPGVGDYFTDSLIGDIQSLALFHGVHTIHLGCHRMLGSRFPFGIYYRETAAETQVVAVLDLRRDPGWIRKQLSHRESQH